MAFNFVKPVEDKVLSLAEEIAAAEAEQTPDVVLGQSGPVLPQSNADGGETTKEAVLGTLMPPMKSSCDTAGAEIPMAEPACADISHRDPNAASDLKECDYSTSPAVMRTTLVPSHRRTSTSIIADQKGQADDLVKHLCRQCRAR